MLTIFISPLRFPTGVFLVQWPLTGYHYYISYCQKVPELEAPTGFSKRRPARKQGQIAYCIGQRVLVDNVNQFLGQLCLF